MSVDNVARLMNAGNSTQLAQISKGAGETANRPTTATVGCMFYDTTLGKPIWLNSTGPNVWKDAAGSTV